MNSYHLSSYFVGGTIGALLFSLTFGQLSRILPTVATACQIILIIVFGISLVFALFSKDKNLIKAWIFALFIIGLGGILAWY